MMRIARVVIHGRNRNTVIDIPDIRIVTFAIITALVGLGTLYSVVYNTYLDTSDPMVAHLKHPLHHTSYFAQKTNIVNQIFIKKGWGWTSLAFWALWASSPQETRTKGRMYKWMAATGVWLLFTTWFFGPSIMQRLLLLSGGECIIRLPAGGVLPVPSQYCYTRGPVSPATHPHLFTTPVVAAMDDWRATPHLMRGHDVSGHMFLLTMGTLFLVDQLKPSFPLRDWPRVHQAAVDLTSGLILIWFLSIWTTSVYWHTPSEKISGFVLGVAGFLATQLPIFRDPTPADPEPDRRRVE